jgi:GT2 family glycosyltransferase
MTAYHHPPGVEPAMLHGRPVLALPRNGRVAIDQAVLDIWRAAHGRSLDEVLQSVSLQGTTPDFVRATLACLSEAGLLHRRGGDAAGTAPMGTRPTTAGAPLVSGIIISYDSLEWLEGSIGTLLSQDYPAIEPIVVDNGSPHDPTPWIAERYPAVRVLRLPPGRSFACAVNQGVAASRGQYAAVLNPDIEMAPDAITRMVRVAEADDRCAAVAAKLTFWWAPGFLNGLGNRVDDRSWGTDNFIGHLDLGQFDALRDVPSACFAAALVRRAAWDHIGPSDEGFPMYYEDTEWSYRARLLGYRIAAAPDAVVQHVFGGKVRSGDESDLTPRKIRNAAYGRLRFALKLLDNAARRRYVRNYLAEDRANLRASLVQRQWASARAYVGAWAMAFNHRRSISASRRELQSARRISDDELFESQRDMPAGLMWHGIPDLSTDVIMNHYLPLLVSGRTRHVPEFATRPVPAS